MIPGKVHDYKLLLKYNFKTSTDGSNTDEDSNMDESSDDDNIVLATKASKKVQSQCIGRTVKVG